MNVSKLSADPEDNIAKEPAHEATHGVGEAGAALAKVYPSRLLPYLKSYSLGV